MLNIVHLIVFLNLQSSNFERVLLERVFTFLTLSMFNFGKSFFYFLHNWVDSLHIFIFSFQLTRFQLVGVTESLTGRTQKIRTVTESPNGRQNSAGLARTLILGARINVGLRLKLGSN